MEIFIMCAFLCPIVFGTYSFFPDAISSWNNLITNFQNVPPLTSLKTHILSLIRPKIKSIPFQLRVNLSPLRSHKRQHNLGIEDTRHFLFECISYATQRVTLAINIINILQRNSLDNLRNQPELYLYGHPSLDFTDNRKVVLSTIKYIKDTKRSSTTVS